MYHNPTAPKASEITTPITCQNLMIGIHFWVLVVVVVAWENSWGEDVADKVNASNPPPSCSSPYIIGGQIERVFGIV